jgi:hypothetical protein
MGNSRIKTAKGGGTTRRGGEGGKDETRLRREVGKLKRRKIKGEGGNLGKRK